MLLALAMQVRSNIGTDLELPLVNGSNWPTSDISRRVELASPVGRCIRNASAIQSLMKSAVIPQIRVEPELRAELESVLRQGETLTDFVEATVRDAIAFRRVQTAFHARAQAASDEYHRAGASVPVETVLERLQSKLDARRKKLGG